MNERDPFSQPPTDLPASDASRELQQTLQNALVQLAQGQMELVRAAAHTGWRSGWQSGCRGHYHSAPELFLQCGGWTEFQLPHSRVRLEAGQALLLPPHLQHAEVVGGNARGPFCNLVFYAEGASFTAHLAHEVRPGVPAIRFVESRSTPEAGQLCAWLQSAAQQITSIAPIALDSVGMTDQNCARPAVADTLDNWRARGLVVATLSRALQLLQSAVVAPHQLPPIVARVRVLVKNHLGDADLSVRGLAQQTGCTADYLSALFHRATGEHLSAHITRLRNERAIQLLAHSELSIKEIAWACGYNAPGYFIQQFRRTYGVTPRAWRCRE